MNVVHFLTTMLGRFFNYFSNSIQTVKKFKKISDANFGFIFVIFKTNIYYYSKIMYLLFCYKMKKKKKIETRSSQEILQYRLS